MGGWQGQKRRCLKTIHAINLFPPKWLPINCFTLTKDGLQTLNITAGHTFPDLHSKPLQGTSANLCYMHSWLLVGDICTSNDRVCKVPLQTKLKPTHHLVGGWQGQVGRCLKTIHAINLFPPKWLPINCFTLTKDGLQTLNITAGLASPKNCDSEELWIQPTKWEAKAGITFLFPALWIKSGCDFRCQMLELTWTRMHVQSAFFWTTFPDLLAHL